MEGTGITPVMNMGGTNGFGFGEGSGIWLFAILALFLFGGNGFGFGGRGADYARQSDVVYTSAFNQLQTENGNIINEIQRTAYDTVANLKDGQYNNLSEIRDLQAQTNAGFSAMQKCCCDTEKSILESRYLNAQAISESNAAILARINALDDKIDQNEIKALQAKVQELQLAQATGNVVRYPNAWTYNAGPSPFCGGCGNI